MEDLPPADGGDDLICNGNMQKLTEIGAFYKNKGGGENDGQTADGNTKGDPASTVSE